MILRVIALAFMVMVASKIEAIAAADRPVRIIVPFPPGGAFDAVARAWAGRAALGPIVVENRPGAGGQIALDDLARAEADGHTLLLGSSMLHPAYDFATIGVLGVAPTAIAVRANLPVRSLTDLIAYVKERPGKLSYGSAGANTLTHIAGELFKTGAGLDLVHVPYKGASPALTDLVGGHITIVLHSATGPLVDLHKAGVIRILAVNARKRTIALPDVPTSAEQGLPQLVCVLKLGVIAPIGTPPAILGRLRLAAVQLSADAGFQAELTALGFEAGSGALLDPGNCRAAAM